MLSHRRLWEDINPMQQQFQTTPPRRHGNAAGRMSAMPYCKYLRAQDVRMTDIPIS